MMKITQISSLRSKLDEFIFFFRTYLLMKITRVSLQSKLDELIQLSTRRAYSPMKITRISLQSKLHELILLFARILRLKYSEFHCNRSWMNLSYSSARISG